MHNHSETAMAGTAIALGFGKLMELLTSAEPILASLSYLVACIAGGVTIYFKLKHKD